MLHIKEIFDDIMLLADILEENGIDAFKIPKGIESEKITAWETQYGIRLPQGYKDFIVLANGFNYSCSQILPLEGVKLIECPEEFKGYYMIGSYIGDGSLILTDKNGDFYYGDHAFGVKKADFLKFLVDDILYYMKDSLKENEIEIPENLNMR